MGWCSLRFTPEVRAWLVALGDDDFGRVACYLDLLRQGQLAAPTAAACAAGFAGWRSPAAGACTG
jgi:hypothetical protein